jgi:hypothetical protein
MKLPVFRAFFAGLALFFTHAGELFKALWLPALLMSTASYFILPSYLDAGARMAAGEHSTDPREAFAALAPAMKYMGLLYLASAVFYPMMIAGNLKYIIRGQTLRLPSTCNTGSTRRASSSQSSFSRSCCFSSIRPGRWPWSSSRRSPQ